jgi:hypothetical protein
LRSKITKGYKEIDINFGTPEEDDGEAKKADGTKIAPSKLPKSVQDIMNFIFDFDLIKSSVVKIGYDAKRMPLG